MDSSSVAEHFGRRLWYRRRLADLTQESLALLIDVHRSEVSEVERGLRVPRLNTILKLAGGVEVSPCDLVAGLRWQPGSQAEVGGAYGGDSRLAAGKQSRAR
jgi:transcriptional regulator with XRE-family HTH domain